MPTYQYACTACEESLEAVQSFSDAPLAECPACGGRLRKKYGSVGVVFKGSGFYKNDSRSEGKKSDAGSSPDATPKKDSAPAAPAASTTSSASSAGSSSSGGSSTTAA